MLSYLLCILGCYWGLSGLADDGKGVDKPLYGREREGRGKKRRKEEEEEGEESEEEERERGGLG